MTYDEPLAARVRTMIADRVAGPVEEKRMFGGLSFLVAGRLVVAVSGDGLLLRVGDDLDSLLGPDVEPMTMGARTSRTWARIAPTGLRTDAHLSRWLDRALTD